MESLSPGRNFTVSVAAVNIFGEAALAGAAAKQRCRELALVAAREELANDAPTYGILERQSLPGIEARLGGPLDRAAVKELMEVREAYFDRFVEVVDGEWGSLDAFLAQAIGVDDALRERLNRRFVV